MLKGEVEKNVASSHLKVALPALLHTAVGR